MEGNKENATPYTPPQENQAQELKMKEQSLVSASSVGTREGTESITGYSVQEETRSIAGYSVGQEIQSVKNSTSVNPDNGETTSRHHYEPESQPLLTHLEQQETSRPPKDVWHIGHHRLNLVTKHHKPAQLDNRYLQKLLRNLFKSRTKQSHAANDEEKHDTPPSTATVRLQDYRLKFSFAELQRMRLRKLQYKLINLTADMYFDKEEADEWEKLLQQYIEAFRDYEYMTNILSARTDDPFIATTEDPIVRWMAERILRHRANKQKLHETSTRDDDELITEEEWNDLCMAQKLVHDADQSLVTPPIGGTRRDQVEKKQRRSFKVRFLVAAVGGVFLIAPMWLMVLHNTLYTSLVSTSVLVFLFGAVVAWRLDSPKEVLATTAAYAAVLVVFVGTNSSPSETPE